jgi:ribonuclease P protein component
MISSAHRFHGHGSLRFVYRKGKTMRSPELLLKFATNPRRKHYRAAVVVSTKISKSAVVRNRIRRRIYEEIRLQVPEAAACDFVFTALTAHLAVMPAAELQTLVASLIARAAKAESSKPETNQKVD